MADGQAKTTAQRSLRADRVGEIALQALRDQDRGRRRDITDELYDRVNWPIAGTGRILSPRSTAEFDGE